MVLLDTFAGIRDRFYSIVAVLDVAAVSEERHHYDLIQYRLRQRVGLAGRDAGVPQAGCLRSMEDNMPTYIALLNWTPLGISKVGSSAKRLDAGRKAFKKAGVEIKDVYLTMGRHDLICVIEAPDDETYAKAILGLGSQGNVSTETLKAFTEDDYRKLIGSL